MKLKLLKKAMLGFILVTPLAILNVIFDSAFVHTAVAVGGGLIGWNLDDMYDFFLRKENEIFN